MTPRKRPTYGCRAPTGQHTPPGLCARCFLPLRGNDVSWIVTMCRECFDDIDASAAESARIETILRLRK